MPNLNIHWKGYPHYRLPRIRVVSTRRNSIQSRSLSTSGRSSRTVFRIPYQKDNSKKPLRIQFRRRRAPASRAASSTARARRRASVRARHHIQVFGWDALGAELASRVTTESTAPRYLTPHRCSGSKALLRSVSQEDSAIPSADGAASSAVRKIKPSKKSNEYSPRNFAKVPVYWSAGSSSQKESSSNPDRPYFSQQAVQLREASNRISKITTPTVERKRTYDTRVGLKSPTVTELRKSSTRPGLKPINFRKVTSQVSPRRKDTDIGSPEFWEAFKDYRNHSGARSSVSAISGKSVIQSLISDTASRSPSQKRALSRFTKGIELYLQASKSLPQQSLIRSPSTTTVSAYTIQELQPYQSEFQSAGLAITSAEQKGMAKLQKGLTPPPTPPKDERFVKRTPSPAKRNYDTQESQPNMNAAQKNKHPSYASQSTGTTILGWTPPHEKTYGRQKVEAETPSEASSDHTIIGFTPPHELYASPPRRAPVRRPPSPPRPATKKSLPWLRRPDTPPERSLTKKSGVANVEEQRKPSTPLTGWVQTFDIAKLSERKKSQAAEKLKPSAPRPPTEKEWKDMRFSSQPSAANNYMSRAVTELAHQNTSAKVEQLSPVYADIATQTTFTPVGSRQATVSVNQQGDQPGQDRVPLSFNRTETFPLSAKNCKGQFLHLSDEPLLSLMPQSSSEPPKVAWKAAEHDMQTEMEFELEFQETTEPQMAQKNRPSFQSDAKPGERTRTLPFAAAPTCLVGPYQAHPVSRSPNKRANEGSSKWSQVEKVPEVNKGNQLRNPLRLSPLPSCTQCAPPICGQCSGPLNPPRSGPDARPEPEVEPPPMNAPMHARAARSSIQCQQCFPSRQVPAAISSMEVSSPMEVQPVEVGYMESRRSARPIIPVGPWTYPQEPSSPPIVEQAPTDLSKSYNPMKRTRRKSKVDQVLEEFTRLEPMADPMKRPSLPGLGLKPIVLDSAAASAPKNVHRYPAISRAKIKPPMPKVPVVEAPHLPLAPASSVDSYSTKPGVVNDRQVFKGLHVATAAACDEDLDQWIEDITGSSARKFLSALSAFDGLGANTLADVARRAAKQRRQKVRDWEKTREQRIAGQEERQRPGHDIGKEYIIGDQGVVVGPACGRERGSEIDGEDGRFTQPEPRAGC